MDLKIGAERPHNAGLSSFTRIGRNTSGTDEAFDALHIWNRKNVFCVKVSPTPPVGAVLLVDVLAHITVSAAVVVMWVAVSGRCSRQGTSTSDSQK